MAGFATQPYIPHVTTLLVQLRLLSVTNIVLPILVVVVLIRRWIKAGAPAG